MVTYFREKIEFHGAKMLSCAKDYDEKKQKNLIIYKIRQKQNHMVPIGTLNFTEKKSTLERTKACTTFWKIVEKAIKNQCIPIKKIILVRK